MWIEFVKLIFNSIQNKKPSVNWALKCTANMAIEETMTKHDAR